MFGGSKKKTYAIGVDLSGAGLAMAQLANGKEETVLLAGSRLSRPEGIPPGSPQWQRWAIDALGEATSGKAFHGRNVTGALPAAEVFIDHIKCPKPSKGSLADAIFRKIKQKLPFNAAPQNTLIKYIPTEQDNLMVLATERVIVERHLAIYKRAGTKLSSLVAWPVALASCYVQFFGKRTADVNEVVMLLDIRPDCTDVVIGRHGNPLFACSIPIGSHAIQDKNALSKLELDLKRTRQYFQSIYKNVPIERLIFLSGLAADESACKALASQLQIRAQLGDCYEAVAKPSAKTSADLADDGQGSWALAFGLSLS